MKIVVYKSGFLFSCDFSLTTCSLFINTKFTHIFSSQYPRHCHLLNIMVGIKSLFTYSLKCLSHLLACKLLSLGTQCLNTYINSELAQFIIPQGVWWHGPYQKGTLLLLQNDLGRKNVGICFLNSRIGSQKSVASNVMTDTCEDPGRSSRSLLWLNRGCFDLKPKPG